MTHNLNINGTLTRANHGESLIDAALGGGILIPHDCSTGQCETCRVNVVDGQLDSNGSAYGNTVLACQSRILSDATITFEEVPELQSTSATVIAIRELGGHVVEMRLRTRDVLRYRPGQYGRLALRGFPAREYSFSSLMEDNTAPDEIVFQIRRLKDGAVSSELGHAILPGHKAKITAPFGNAFLREQDKGPLVLTCSGTGFAPVWSLAKAALTARQKREMSLTIGVRSPSDIYMLPAIRYLTDHGINNIEIAAKTGARGIIRNGTPDRFLPILGSKSCVHVAGNPHLVDRVRELAEQSNAKCYADPFTPSRGRLRLRDKLLPMFA